MSKLRNTRIRDRLEELNVAQWDLSKRLDLHPSYLNRIINGETTPNAARAAIIARELGTTVEKLWGEAA